MQDTNKDFRNLLSPFHIGKVRFKNRFIFLPHLTGYALDAGYMECGLVSDRNVRHYVERAKGGAAAVTVSQNVDAYSQMSDEYIVGNDPRNKDMFKRLADEVHAYDCRVITQLNQGGHTTLKNPPQLLHAPSQMPEPSCHFNVKELEKDDLMRIKDAYVASAAMQKEVGWDAVELKIAHDGLLRTFVSPFFNRRTDEYGCDFEGMMRYPLEVIAAIREAVGPDYPIGIRLCLDEFIDNGYSLEYGLKLGKRLEEAGVDYFSSDAGTFSSFYMEIPPAPIPLGFAIYMSAELKKVVDIPVIAFGRINDPVMAETILAEGNADLVGMCRQLLCDPETPIKTMEGRLDDIRHCIACNEGCIGKDGIDVECVQNPGVGREKLFGIGTLPTAEQKKNVMVIGGGIAGMKAAEIAARRGHSVSLYEKTGELGGQMLLAVKYPYKVEMEEGYRYLKIQVQQLGVDIHLHTEVDTALVERVNPDAVIAATGSFPFITSWEGQDEADYTIMDVRTAMRNVDKIGDNVVILDETGFWQGAGLADYVVALGANVTVVTGDYFLAQDVENSSCLLMHKRLYKGGADIITSHSVKKLTKTSVVIQNVFSGKTREIKGVDTFLFAGRSCSDNALYNALKASGREVYAVGDCVAPRAIEQVLFESEEVTRTV